MESRQEQWLRAKVLYTQVLGLGLHSSHRADALFFLGWTEYQLGNRSQARTHFDTFIDGFSSDSRRSEAEAMSLICHAEESLLSAEQLSGLVEFFAQRLVISKLQAVVTLIDLNINRVQNIGYRTRLQDLATSAGIDALERLEDEGEYLQADVVYRQLRRILAYNCPDTALTLAISNIVAKHVRAGDESETGKQRIQRAEALLGRAMIDFPDTLCLCG